MIFGYGDERVLEAEHFMATGCKKSDSWIRKA